MTASIGRNSPIEQLKDSKYKLAFGGGKTSKDVMPDGLCAAFVKSKIVVVPAGPQGNGYRAVVVSFLNKDNCSKKKLQKFAKDGTLAIINIKNNHIESLSVRNDWYDNFLRCNINEVVQLNSNDKKKVVCKIEDDLLFTKHDNKRHEEITRIFAQDLKIKL